MNTRQIKKASYNYFDERNNEKFIFDIIINKKNLIQFNIKRENSIPNTFYSKEFSLEDLQKISKYFKVFDLMEEVFDDIKSKFDKKDYEINFEEIETKINIKIKTNVNNLDFSLEIPIKKLEPEKIIKDLCITIKKHDDNIKELLQRKRKEPDKKYDEKIKELEKKFKNLEDIINLKKIDKIILFEKSTIIKNNYERKLLESFIKENDVSKKEIFPVLLYKATVDGDNAVNFHIKCDYMGATLTIVQSENGRRFGGYTSVSWDNQKNNWVTEGINFLFSLDTRKYYKNISGTYHTYHNNVNGPTFGGGFDLCIKSGCLSNNESYTNKLSYGMTSAYELNGGIKNFKVLDYEVYQI